MSTVIYTLTRSPTKRLADKTPKEVWSSKRPNVSHLMIFGSLCFRHGSAQDRRKLDDIAE